jgi:hypothetical protein
MAEILVTDIRARRLSAAGVFVGCRYHRAMRQHAPGFPTVSIVLRIVFFIVIHCSCAGRFSLAVARPCIVNPVVFPLQIACIFLQPLSEEKSKRGEGGRCRVADRASPQPGDDSAM